MDSGFFDDLTAQNLHPRVQVSPINMKVAVPPFQHSPIFGQLASSQTVLSLRLVTFFLIQEKRPPPGKGTFNHGGFFVDNLVEDIYK